MAHSNDYYRDQRGVEEALVRNGGFVNSGNGSTIIGSNGNSLSLEELFINGVGARGGQRTDHPSSQDIIRLDHPRPDVLRACNEYVDVTRNKTPSRAERRLASGRQSMVHFPGRAIARRNDDWSLEAAHRAHSLPLSTSAAVCQRSAVNCDSTNGQTNCLYCVGRSPVSNLTNGNQRIFDGATCSKSATTFTSLIECHPSTSFAAVPGRPIRVTNTPSIRNGSVVLPSSTIISSQPKNSTVSLPIDKNSKRDACWRNSRMDGNRFAPDCSSSSLICKHCGRCRCSSCKIPRTLPSREICNQRCTLSKENVVDAISCMYCIQGCLYHVGADSNDFDDSCAANRDCAKPCASSALDSSVCSCSRNSLLRWTIWTAAVLCLPCVWCYLPLKGCAAGVEAMYTRYHDHGCKCDRRSSRRDRCPNGDRSVTRRLRRKRSHTLPPELPSIAAAKAAACGDYNRAVGCSGSSDYS